MSVIIILFLSPEYIVKRGSGRVVVLNYSILQRLLKPTKERLPTGFILAVLSILQRLLKQTNSFQLFCSSLHYLPRYFDSKVELRFDFLSQ
mmetsp:Transcript_19133/g.28870  ORF Transcript_19133/g.28870 Transcript_19133/m.28870 type:complete len:91 (-) Transcript_19133:292-564(-)